MIFIHPMWDSENQRLGLKACTPFGYFLHEVADGIGFVGLFLLLLGAPAFLFYRAIVHRFSWYLCWWLLVPFAIGIIGRILFEVSWRFAARKHFEYDVQTMTVRWIEAGEARVFPGAT